MNYYLIEIAEGDSSIAGKLSMDMKHSKKQKLIFIQS